MACLLAGYRNFQTKKRQISFPTRNADYVIPKNLVNPRIIESVKLSNIVIRAATLDCAVALLHRRSGFALCEIRMRMIRSTISALAIWCATGSLAWAVSVYDVIELSRQGYSDEEIVKVIRTTRSVFKLTAEDIPRLKNLGVNEVVNRAGPDKPLNLGVAVQRLPGAIQSHLERLATTVPDDFDTWREYVGEPS